MKEVTNFLKEHDIRPSYQRIRIYEYISTMKNHPTIEMIYNSLTEEIPSLSKTTIYNTVRLFVNSGIMQPITIEDHEIRYDANVMTHVHFKCNECGKIEDFFLKETWFDFKAVIPDSYMIQDEHLYARGVCSECKSK